jgi:ATP-dependent Lon protease
MLAGSYLETLLALPWTSAESTPISLSKDFVAQARKKLDEDHYGLGAPCLRLAAFDVLLTRFFAYR